jgi:hypothetical protein
MLSNQAEVVASLYPDAALHWSKTAGISGIGTSLWRQQSSSSSRRSRQVVNQQRTCLWLRSEGTYVLLSGVGLRFDGISHATRSRSLRGRPSAWAPCGLLPWGVRAAPELRVDSRDVCFCLDYGWKVLLDPPMLAGRFTETPPDQSLVRHGAGALWCLRRFGDSCRCEKSGRIRRARPGRRRIPRPAFSSGSAAPSRVRGRLTRLRARSPCGVADGSTRGTAFRGWAARGKWVGSPRSALGQGVVHARRRNVRVAETGPLPSGSALEGGPAGTAPKVMASLPLAPVARWRSACTLTDGFGPGSWCRGWMTGEARLGVRREHRAGES